MHTVEPTARLAAVNNILVWKDAIMAEAANQRLNELRKRSAQSLSKSKTRYFCLQHFRVSFLKMYFWRVRNSSVFVRGHGNAG